MVDAFRLDEGVESSLDGFAAKEDDENVGSCECNDKAAHAPEEGMKSLKWEHSSIEEQDRYLGQG